jgi:hypothetical protein
VRGEPDALLLVEFAEDGQDENLRRLLRAWRMMGDLGWAIWATRQAKWGGVVTCSTRLQAAIWEVRKPASTS